MEYVSPISAPRIAYLRGLNDRCRRLEKGSSIAAATSVQADGTQPTTRLVSLPIRVPLRPRSVQAANWTAHGDRPCVAITLMALE